jgi:hypothetical protein
LPTTVRWVVPQALNTNQDIRKRRFMIKGYPKPGRPKAAF